MAHESRLTGTLWLAKWAAIILALTFVVHELYALWPYPQGFARGSAALRANLEREWRLLTRLGDARFVSLAYRVHADLYFALFRLPGLDHLLRAPADPAAARGAGTMVARLVLASHDVWATAAVGLQLFSARLSVLITALPLVALTALGAGVDGLVVWYLRRSGGGRESGFIYHRSKRLAGFSLVLMAAIYLVPPIVMDPRWLFPPFLLAFALAIRCSTAYFKKYL